MAKLPELLEAVYERPDDDAPRAVYADALQEAGDLRGEFISLQLAGIVNERTHDLAKRFAQMWLGDLAAVVIASEWKRGFPETVLVDMFKSYLFPPLQHHRGWATIRMVELGGGMRWQPTSVIQSHHKVVHESLLKAPGAATRKFKPSYIEVQSGAVNDRFLLR